VYMYCVVHSVSSSLQDSALLRMLVLVMDLENTAGGVTLTVWRKNQLGVLEITSISVWPVSKAGPADPLLADV
jgi:hypothetical protein